MSERVHSLDLVRGGAALSVAIPHFFIQQDFHIPLFEAASIYGVEIFFVLSGFVLAPQLQYCWEQDRRAIYMRFLARRWMRTLPPYFIALILFTVAFGRLFSPDFKLYALFLQNLTSVYVDNDYFQISWSLAVEEWFYVAFPLTIAVACRFGRPNLMHLAIGFIAVFLVARTLLGDFSEWGADVRRVVAFRLDSIGLGVLLYLIGQRMGGFAPGRSLLFLGLSLAAAVGVMYAIMATDSTLAKHLFFLAAGAMGAGFIMLAQAVEPQVRKLRAAVLCADFLGKISYSVYLFHLLVIFALTSAMADMPLAGRLGIFLAVLIAITGVFFYVVEQPILRNRPSLRPPSQPQNSVYLNGATSDLPASTTSAANNSTVSSAERTAMCQWDKT